MLNVPPWSPVPLPTAEGAQEPTAVGQHTYDYGALPQRIGNVDKHIVFIPFPLGVLSAGVYTPGLGPGQTVTYNLDQCPEGTRWIASVDGEATANIRVYLGAGVGGPYIPIGQGGSAKIPARAHKNLTVTNIGTGTAFGAVIATNDPDFDVSYQAASGPDQKGTATTFSTVGVTTSGGSVLAANARRKSALFQNNGANNITLGKSAVPVAGSGIVLAAGQTFNDTATTDQWFAIAVTGTTNLSIMEVS